MLTKAGSSLKLIKAGDQGDWTLQDPPNQSQRKVSTMAKISIDPFPILKQWKAVISPMSLWDNLAIPAEHLYGSRQFSAEPPYNFERVIKEGI